MAKVELKVNDDGIIEEVVFKANRMAFANATKKILNQLFPEYASGEKNVQHGIDRRHWESNAMIKARIQTQCTGRHCKEVASWMVDFGVATKPPTTTKDLEWAIYRFWRTQFSLVTNLRLGPSQPNQALGRLSGRLLKVHAKYKGDPKGFIPFSVSMEDFGWGEDQLLIESWDMLIEMIWNTNYDFIFEGTAAAELEIAEQDYGSAIGPQATSTSQGVPMDETPD